MTTKHELYECPDGSAFIKRSGDGVYVRSATEGDFYAWEEKYVCEGATPVHNAKGVIDVPQAPLVVSNLIITNY